MSTTDPLGRLTGRERAGLLALACLAVLFGAETLRRSAFMQRRMTDAEVFFRAGWAVRSGADLYDITDTNGWHYLYPSAFAAAMVPLAVPPPGETLAWTLPYPVAVAVWYAIGLVALLLGVHWSAQAVEEAWARSRGTAAHSARAPPRRPAHAPPTPAPHPPFTRIWWSLRVWPLLACLVAVGATLGRGQVATLLLALIARCTLEAVRGRSGRAGLWLAAAIALKVIPAFLLIVPALRRDWRWLAGCAVGLAVLLGVLPAAVFGPARTLVHHQRWVQVMFAPAVESSDATPADRSRWDELHSFRRNDNQSPLAILHHARWIGTPLADRPERPARGTQVAHLLLVGALTLATVLAAGWSWRRLRAAWPVAATPALVGAFTCVMLMAAPVCQPDYFTLALPAVAAVLGVRILTRVSAGGSGDLTRAELALVALYVLVNLLPKLNGLESLKMYGLSAAAGLALWWACLRSVRSVPPPPARPM